MWTPDVFSRTGFPYHMLVCASLRPMTPWAAEDLCPNPPTISNSFLLTVFGLTPKFWKPLVAYAVFPCRWCILPKLKAREASGGQENSFRFFVFRRTQRSEHTLLVLIGLKEDHLAKIRHSKALVDKVGGLDVSWSFRAYTRTFFLAIDD